jgi:two-component system, LuxR family, response regulator FixJ
MRLRTLTPREGQVLLMVVEGKGNRTIGEQMDISISLVKAYKRRIIEKVQSTNERHLIHMCMLAGVNATKEETDVREDRGE